MTNVGNLTLCGPQTANSNVTGGFAPYNYLWSTNSTNSSITISELGDYEITVTDFCGQTYNEEFSVVPPSGVSLEMDDDVFVCLNATVDATVNMVAGANPPTCAWTGSNSTTTTATFDASDVGMQYVVVTDACGQTGTDSILVTIPTIMTGVDDLDLCVGVGTGELATGGTEPYVYTYDTDAFTPSTIDVLVPELAGVYTIDVEDACGQQATVAVLVEICDTRIPNVFTPNGDDKNDYFEIFGILNFPQSNLQVYNRWGNLVYENSNYTNKWKGDDLPTGVYFYTLKRSDGKSYEGYVHILREK
jgi:gliding motility-associated-like protein